jgi:hypothetical protein
MNVDVSDLSSRVDAICGKEFFTYKDVLALENAAQEMQTTDVTHMTPQQLCDFLQERIAVELAKAEGEKLGFPPSFLEQIPLQVLFWEIVIQLIDDPESIASLCMTSKYFLEVCKQSKVPGIQEDINVWDYVKAGLSKCLLYQWLAFLSTKMKQSVQMFQDFLLPYQDTSMEQLYRYVDSIGEGDLIARVWIPPLYVACNFQDFEATPRVSKLIPLYSTPCEYNNTPIWVAELPVYEFPILARSGSSEFMAIRENRKKLFDTIRSKDFEDVILRRLREEYDLISVEIRKTQGIESRTCARLWLPDIVHINWHVMPMRGEQIRLYYTPFESKELRKQ